MSDRAIRSALGKALRGVWAVARPVVTDRHFLLAAALLGITAAGWGYAVEWLGVVTQKRSVPWPEGVRVSSDFRLLSLPEQMGPYRLIEDGEVSLPDDVKESLGVGTSFDETRYEDRRSNWYSVRVYRDTRLEDPSASPFGLWRLELTYYTGGMDTVPHIPEVCLAAAGAQLLEDPSGAVQVNLPEASRREESAWNDPFEVRRTVYAVSDGMGGQTYQLVQYYVFSLNGEPTRDWKEVRLRLTMPWVRYCYFAKIQFSPLGKGGARSLEQVDRKAEEFLRTVLPHVLEVFPTSEAVEQMEAADAGDNPTGRSQPLSGD